MTPRVPDPSELAEDIEAIKHALAAISEKLEAKFVPRELYEARHTALRAEIALELAAIKAQQDTDRKVAEGARGISMWALGLLCSAVLVALVGFLFAAGGGTS